MCVDAVLLRGQRARGGLFGARCKLFKWWRSEISRGRSLFSRSAWTWVRIFLYFAYFALCILRLYIYSPHLIFRGDCRIHPLEHSTGPRTSLLEHLAIVVSKSYTLDSQCEADIDISRTLCLHATAMQAKTCGILFQGIVEEVAGRNVKLKLDVFFPEQ